MVNFIKIGIVGLGDVAVRVHLPLWLRMKDTVQVVALCDTDPKRLESASRQFHIKKLYTHFTDMVAKEHLDLVDICSPPATHGRLCFEALTAGLNCIVEKPLATSIEDANSVVSVAREKKLHLFVIQNYSFVPVLRKAKNLLNNGEIGDVLQVDVKLSLPILWEYLDPNHWAHKLPGGLFGELAPHPCFVVTEFLNGDIRDVKARAIKRSSYPFLVGDELGVLVSTQNALGSFHISFNSPTRKMVVNILGSKLWVFVDAESQVIVKYAPIAPGGGAVMERGTRALSDIFQRIGCLADVSFNVAIGKYNASVEGHRYLFLKAINALRGQGVYPISLDDILKQVGILHETFSQLDLASMMLKKQEDKLERLTRND